MESKENKDLDGFVKRKIDEIPVDYKEAHWDKAFLVLEASMPLLPKSNWLWLLSGADMLLLAGSAALVAGNYNSPQKTQAFVEKKALKAPMTSESVMPATSDLPVASNSASQEHNATNQRRGQETFYAFNSSPSEKQFASAISNADAAKPVELNPDNNDSENTSSPITDGLNEGSEDKLVEKIIPTISNLTEARSSGSSNSEFPTGNSAPETTNPTTGDQSELLQNNNKQVAETKIELTTTGEATKTATAEEIARPPDLEHADMKLHSSFSLLLGGGAANALGDSKAPPGVCYGLSVQFNRTLRKNIDLIGSAGLNYRNRINQTSTIDQLVFGFGSSVVESKVNWQDMVIADLRGGVVLSACQRHHFALTAGTAFLLNTRAEVVSAGGESVSKAWGYRDGFNKVDIILGARYEFEFCQNWRGFVQYTQGLTDMMNDHYFNTPGKQTNSSMQIGLHYFIKPKTNQAVEQYVKP